MQDYELKVLEQYPIEVKSTRKVRGAFLCDTDKGYFLLKEVGTLGKRVPALYQLYDYLQKQGYKNVDQFLPNKEGECISKLEDETPYIVKHWFQGRESDVRKSKELLDGAKNLARIHSLMQIPIDGYIPPASSVGEEYISHNRELKKVRKFMRSQSQKGEFELAFLKCFPQVYAWAELALDELTHSGYQELYLGSLQRNYLTHGEYNYHNILVVADGIATTNFDKCKYNIQIEDLYYYLRKAMEKHAWNVRLCDCIINAYCAVRPVSIKEMEYLKIRFLYPEKFWKIADTYYRSNKAWISVKNVEKLHAAITQMEEKNTLLKQIFSL